MNLWFWKKDKTANLSEEAIARVGYRGDITSSEFHRLWSCVAAANNIMLNTSQLEDLLDYIMSLEVKTAEDGMGPATMAFENLARNGGWNKLAVSSYETNGKQSEPTKPEDLAAITDFLRDRHKTTS